MNDKKRRILVISDAWLPQVNGVVRTYEHLGDELRKRGHDFHVIGPADFPRRIKLPGYAEIELALFPYSHLKNMIAAHAPTTIHIATEGPLGWAARRYCRTHGIRFTTAYHTQFPDYAAKRLAKHLAFLHAPVKKLATAWLRHFHSPAAGIITTTPSLNAELKEKGYTTSLHAMNRGAALEIFQPGEATLFHDMKQPVALYVGRLAIEKNLEDFLAMRWNGTKIVVGEGPSLGAFKRKYPDVIFTGKKTGAELAAHYRSAHVFVFPSRTDTFGIVLVEALACGLPVAAYNVTGPRDIITDDFLGVLHDDDLSSAANKALLLKDHATARAAHAQKNYAWETIAKQFLDILDVTQT